jgi:hypothetical protein
VQRKLRREELGTYRNACSVIPSRRHAFASRQGGWWMSLFLEDGRA